MKSPVSPFKDELTQATDKARETIAATMFADMAVKGKLLEAAGKGFTACAFPLEAPVDLRETEAAKRVVTWATRSGLHCEWMQRTYLDKDGVNSGQIFELLIRWDGGRMAEPAAKLQNS